MVNKQENNELHHIKVRFCTIVLQLENESDHQTTSRDEHSSDVSSYNFAVGLFTLPNLHTLSLCGVRLSKVFYEGMDSVSRRSKVESKSFHWYTICYDCLA